MKTNCSNAQYVPIDLKKKSYLHQLKECVHESNVPYKCELCQEEFDREKN